MGRIYVLLIQQNTLASIRSSCDTGRYSDIFGTVHICTVLRLYCLNIFHTDFFYHVFYQRRNLFEWILSNLENNLAGKKPTVLVHVQYRVMVQQYWFFADHISCINTVNPEAKEFQRSCQTVFKNTVSQEFLASTVWMM